MKSFLTPIASVLCVALLAADWSRIGGPAGDFQTAEKGLFDAKPPAPLKALWSRDVGAGYAGAAVAGGKVYVFHRVGTEDVVESIDLKTGKVAWKFAAESDYRDNYGKGDGPRSTPAVADGRVFALNPAGVLYALDAKDGKKIWSKNLVATYDVPANFFGVGTSPVVEGGLVLVNVGGAGAGVVALDAATGKEAWKVGDHGASYSSPVVATIDGVKAAIFLAREGLVGVDAKTGKQLFTRRFRARINASVNAANPVMLDAKTVLLTASYDTGAASLSLTKDAAKVVWEDKKSLSAHFTTPVAVGGIVFGIDGRQEEGGSLRAIDAKTGAVKFTEAGFGCGSLVAAGKTLWVLTEGGELVMVAAGEKYAEVYRQKILGAGCFAPIALADGVIVARDAKKMVAVSVKK